MSRRVLVTGGAGFIGSHLADELLSAGHTVRVLDNLRNGRMENLSLALKNPRFEFIHGDVTKAEDCRKAALGCDAIFHLACLGVRHSLHSPLENHFVNAQGTLQMLEAAREAAVGHFFYISTSEVYGRVEQFPIKESALPKPTTVYGSSKLAGEHYTLSYGDCFGVNATVLRVFNNFGPRAHYEGDCGEIIPRSIVRILGGQSPVIFGDGLITRDFLFVRDTTRALTSLLEFPNLNGETFNIGAGSELCMREMLEQLVLAMGSKVAITFAPSRPADLPRLWVDATKFQRATGFRAKVSFAEGLQETIAYYQELFQQGKLQSVPIENWKHC